MALADRAVRWQGEQQAPSKCVGAIALGARDGVAAKENSYGLDEKVHARKPGQKFSLPEEKGAKEAKGTEKNPIIVKVNEADFTTYLSDRGEGDIFVEVDGGYYAVGDIVVGNSGPSFSMGNTVIRDTGEYIKFEVNGSSFTEAVLKLEILEYKKIYKRNPPSLSGSLVFKNKENFQLEFYKIKRKYPMLSDMEIGNLAIRKISFGTHRIELGYGYLVVKMNFDATGVPFEIEVEAFPDR